MSDARSKFALPYGTVVPPARGQSSSSPLSYAAKTVKVRHGTLRILLAAEGKICPEKPKGSRVHVAQADIARLAEDYANSLPFAGVAPLLGVGCGIAGKLRDAGELPVWMPGGKHGAKHRYLYRRQDLEKWVDDLICSATTLTFVPPGYMLLADVPLRLHFPTMQLVQAIRQKRVIVLAHLRGRPKFGSAIISVRNAREHVPEEVRLKLGSRRSGPRGPYTKRHDQH